MVGSDDTSVLESLAANRYEIAESALLLEAVQTRQADLFYGCI